MRCDTRQKRWHRELIIRKIRHILLDRTARPKIHSACVNSWYDELRHSRQFPLPLTRDDVQNALTYGVRTKVFRSDAPPHKKGTHSVRLYSLA
jgi:hypothetical protein